MYPGKGTVVLIRPAQTFYERIKLGLAYACIALTILSALAIPKLLGVAIDEALTAGLRSEQLRIAALILAASVVRGLSGFGQNYVLESVAQHAEHDVRRDLFSKLMSLSFGFHDRHRTVVKGGVKTYQRGGAKLYH